MWEARTLYNGSIQPQGTVLVIVVTRPLTYPNLTYKLKIMPNTLSKSKLFMVFSPSVSLKTPVQYLSITISIWFISLQHPAVVCHHVCVSPSCVSALHLILHLPMSLQAPMLCSISTIPFNKEAEIFCIPSFLAQQHIQYCFKNGSF